MTRSRRSSERRQTLKSQKQSRRTGRTSSKINECNLPLFRHQPLDLSQRGIRLIDVLPRDGQPDIRCKIRHVLLSNHDGNPDYAALSYVWGVTSSPRHQITIEGRRYYIHENLFRFLDIHGVHGMSNLFIDAICIDQQNLKEQNHQVGLMSTIFARASKVIMWLGLGNDLTDELLDLVKAFDGIWDTVDSGRGDSDTDVPCLVVSDFCRGRDYAAVAAFEQQFLRRPGVFVAATKHIYQRSYWTRTWIIQEILLARRLQLVCGEKSLDWLSWMWYIGAIRQLERGARLKESAFTDFSLLIQSSPMYRICAQWIDKMERELAADLLFLVRQFAASECLRVHDKVYALLGLTTNTGYITVDYEMPAELLLIWLVVQSYNETSMHDLVDLCKILRVSPSRLMLALDIQGSMQTLCAASELEALAGILLKAVPSSRGEDATRFYPAESNPVPAHSCVSVQENNSLAHIALVPAFSYEIELHSQNLWKWANDGGLIEYVWPRVPIRICFCVRCRKRHPTFAGTLVRLSKAMINVGYSTSYAPSWMSRYQIALLYRNDRTNAYLATGIHSSEKGGPMTLFYDPPAVPWPPGKVSLSLLNLINLLAHCDHFHPTSGTVDSTDDIVGRPIASWGAKAFELLGRPLKASGR